MTRKRVLYIMMVTAFVSGCIERDGQSRTQGIPFFEVSAQVETTPVTDPNDAADDPSIWYNATDPSKSTIIGTNKQRGLEVYDLDGKILFRYDWGRINNVDVRYGFPAGDRAIDIVAGSNRTDNSITVAGIDPATGGLEILTTEPILSNLDEVYGFCLYHDVQTDRYFAFVNGTDGGVEQWLLSWDPVEKMTGELVRTFALESQTEGCVADDELGYLYIGEEAVGIWRFDARPEGGDLKVLVDGMETNSMLHEDIEGLTIYYGNDGNGYLIASSQGNNSYAIYERNGNNKYLGSFKIVNGENIDGTNDTDGIDVSSKSFGPSFPEGIFIAQDGTNEELDGTANQNFKVVSWDRIADAFDQKMPTKD